MPANDDVSKDDLISQMLDALYSILNMEGGAKAAARVFTAYQGLDCSEFDKVRRAIRLAEDFGHLPEV